METIDETHPKIHRLKPVIIRVIASPKVGGGEIDAFT